MSEADSLQGLNCPNCGGMVPIPEGQVIVRCPYCELRSFVHGERGLRRYQVPQRINRQTATDSLKTFLTSSMAIARNAANQAELNETILVYLPFWTIWGRVAGWAFGQERVGSGDKARYEPREVRVVQEMTWNNAACDVGEFGVKEVLFTNQPLEPFNPTVLHATGMVFEPVGSFAEARSTAENQFLNQVQARAKLDRLSQAFVRLFRQRTGLVYYPLWVLRYLYRGRVFQVVLDGYDGKVLYGKAPGNTLYRALALVGGMAGGAFLAVDVPAILLSIGLDGDEGSNILLAAGVAFLAGLGVMLAAYRAFRYGEQYEYRLKSTKSKLPGLPGFENPLESITNIKDIEQWISKLT